MHTYTLKCEMLTNRSLWETFEIFENPHNLTRITPSWLNFVVTSKDVQMGKGAEIEYTIRWLGLPFRWKTLISDYEPPFWFTDEQAKGPYKLWKHRHTFEPTPEGTKVGDLVEYALPFGTLGRLVHKLVVRKQLEQIFQYRQQELGKMLGGTIQVQEPMISG